MSDEEPDALTRRVQAFYERYHFPSFRPVEQDGLILMRRLARIASTWKGRESGRQMRVLDAGCGTGNTLVARAVARLAKLLGWLRPHWSAFDRLLVVKGPGAKSTLSFQPEI